MQYSVGRVIDDSLFTKENSSSPPSLITETGEIFHGIKSDLMHCLLEYVDILRERPVSPDSPATPSRKMGVQATA